MTSGTGLTVLNNEVRGRVTVKVTFEKDLKFMMKQTFDMSEWERAGHGQDREGMSWATSQGDL